MYGLLYCVTLQFTLVGVAAANVDAHNDLTVLYVECLSCRDPPHFPGLGSARLIAAQSLRDLNPAPSRVMLEMVAS